VSSTPTFSLQLAFFLHPVQLSRDDLALAARLCRLNTAYLTLFKAGSHSTDRVGQRFGCQFFTAPPTPKKAALPQAESGAQECKGADAKLLETVEEGVIFQAGGGCRSQQRLRSALTPNEHLADGCTTS